MRGKTSDFESVSGDVIYTSRIKTETIESECYVEDITMRPEYLLSESDKKIIRDNLKEYCLESDGRVHQRFMCDGTLLFINETRFLMEAAGCKDIRVDTEIVDASEAPKDKPWCTMRCDISGVLEGDAKTVCGAES